MRTRVPLGQWSCLPCVDAVACDSQGFCQEVGISLWSPNRTSLGLRTLMLVSQSWRVFVATPRRTLCGSYVPPEGLLIRSPAWAKGDRGADQGPGGSSEA